MTLAAMMLSVAATLAAVAAVRWHRKFHEAARAYVDCLAAKSAYDAAVQEMSRRIAVSEPGVVLAPVVSLGRSFAESLLKAYREDPDLPVTYDVMKEERDRAARAAVKYRSMLDRMDAEVRRIPDSLRDALDSAVGADVLPMTNKLWVHRRVTDICDKILLKAADTLSCGAYTCGRGAAKQKGTT